MADIEISVISMRNGGDILWRVQSHPHGEILAQTADKDEAIQVARRIADERGAELIVHSADGGVETREAYDWGTRDTMHRTLQPETTVKTVSVVRGEGWRWLVEGDGPEEILGRHDAREPAIKSARRLAQERNAQLVVYRENGEIEWSEDYACAIEER